MSHIKCPLREAAAISPHQVAVVQGSREITFHELNAMVSASAMKMQAAGVSVAARVGVLLPNDWRTVVTFLALIRLGAVVCPLHSRWPVAGLEQCAAQVEMDLLITTQGRLDECAAVCSRVTAAESVLDYSITEEEKGLSTTLEFNRPAALFFTSGSSGRPKAVLHNFDSLYYSALGTNSVVQLRSGDEWLLTLPLYHVSGFSVLYRFLLAGARLIIPQKNESWLQLCAQRTITHTSLVHTQLQELLLVDEKHREAMTQSLRAVLLGGAAVHKRLISAARQARIPVLYCYGMTETASNVSAVGVVDPPDVQQTAGRILKYRELQISEEGEIMVRGHVLFSGYVERQQLHAPFDDGWYYTGDLGELDDNGCLTVTGRRDRMFISGGENIHPEEIEEMLLNHADVYQAVVVPLADETYGMRPVAFVQTISGELDGTALQSHLQEHLPAYKIPKHYLPLPTADELGKVDRQMLAQLAEQMLT